MLLVFAGETSALVHLREGQVHRGPAHGARAMLAEPLVDAGLMPLAMAARQSPRSVTRCQGLMTDCAFVFITLFLQRPPM